MSATPRIRLREDRGSHMVELAIGSALMTLVVLGITGTMGSGMKIVANSRQRSAGSEVAQERLERAHNIAYDDVALAEAPAHNPDAGHPDHAVSVDGTRYRLADGTEEPLIVDTADGGLKHVDDPFVLGTTAFSVHQYVTGVDDPGVVGTLDYKRVTVVVTWKVPQHGGGANTVVQSTFVGKGSVTVAAASPSPTPTAAPPSGPSTPAVPDVLGTGRPIGPAPTLDPEATPGAGSACPGDVAGPAVTSMKVLSGSGTEPGYLSATTVQMLFTVVDTCDPIELYLANAESADRCSSLAAGDLTRVATVENETPSTVAWTIDGTNGPKGICAVTVDGNRTQSQAWGADVYLDTAAPAAPAGFRHTACTMLATQRTILFVWLPSLDENLLGYRIYRSVDSTSFQLVGTTSSLGATDVSLKSPASVRYLVKAYDKAGTESPGSNVLSYAKNSC